MTRARATLVDASRPGVYHLVSRCVRRAFLCGGAAEHRRQWVETGLRTQAGAFAIEVLTFSVLSNHMHVVVRTDPDRAQAWSAREVVERWARLFPRLNPRTREVEGWDDAELERKANDPRWVAKRRERLASVSWFMRLLKERIARRANREDGVTGHFWEGRFTSVPLLDDAAVLSCMAYVDLNPVRAGMAPTPEASAHTGVQRRIEARQAHRKAAALCAQAECTADTKPAASIDPQLLTQARGRRARGPEHGLWIAPMLRATNGHFDLDHYLDLVDHTGRMLVSGKRGAIPPHLRPILERLQIDVDSWLAVMLAHGKFLGTAVGALAHLIVEAARRGVRWIAEKTHIHRDRRNGPSRAPRPAPA